MQSQAQQLPDFLANTNAIPMTDAEMAEVQGESFIGDGIKAILIPFTLGRLIGNCIFNTCSDFEYRSQPIWLP